jgi:hypothetical protein
MFAILPLMVLVAAAINAIALKFFSNMFGYTSILFVKRYVVGLIGLIVAIGSLSITNLILLTTSELQERLWIVGLAIACVHLAVGWLVQAGIYKFLSKENVQRSFVVTGVALFATIAVNVAIWAAVIYTIDT